MQTTQNVRCPNCGSFAERHYFLTTHLIHTECIACDYLMVNCSRTGNVIEAYAPGIYAGQLNFQSGSDREPNLVETQYALPQKMAR